MADVRPLRGIRYNDEVVGDLAQVVTPPYDVISKEAQAKYYARNPYNVIRLEFGAEQVGDSTLNNRYTRAAAALAEWRLQAVLHQDALPGYYLYQQMFSQNGQPYTRTSLLARVRLEPWSSKVVLPHEHTMSKPKDDRLKLLRACATNLSPIMSLYDDPQGRIRRLLGAYADKAEVRITDEVGEEHRLQHITDPAQIDLIQNFFAERQLYIADGHHRYETALNYREEIREQRRQLHVDDAVQFVLMALVDVDDPGLLVLPTHRLLSALPITALRALSTEQLARYFTVSESGSETASDALLAQLAQAGTTEPALVLSTGEQNWLLRLNEQGRRRMAESGHSDAWNDLDVAVAHTLILEALLGIQTEDVTAGTYLRYTRDAQQAVQAVHTGEAQAALLLNATRVRQIRDVSQADDRMPQKST
ncbi:MAG TPA: DUF1015 domain-containing protein, partial [Ktedonobacteraceae bacterium]|nr:DUF1015 domain-containing protein [Ktedonobacteraceae bacterium]